MLSKVRHVLPLPLVLLLLSLFITDCSPMDLCPINCVCLNNDGNCVIRSLSSLCLLKWGRLVVEINSWNLTDDVTFSMCRSLHSLTITGDLEFIDGSKLRVPSDNVTDVRIENSGLQVIHDRSLEHLPFVRNLIITSNPRLSNLSRYFLHGLRQVYLLDLSFNGLVDISDSFQTVLSDLRILKLNYNKLTTIQTDTFKYLRHLKVLELSNNRLGTIEEFGFRGLLSVVSLQLNNNLLVELNHLDLLEMVSLQHVNLRNNKLDSFNLPSCNRELKIVDLKNNNLSLVPIFSRTRCPGIKRLFIKHNFISECAGKKLLSVFDLNICDEPIDGAQCVGRSNSSFVGLCIVLIVISLCILTLAIFVPILISKHKKKTGFYKFQFGKSLLHKTISNQVKEADIRTPVA